MSYDLRQWPGSVYGDAMKALPNEEVEIDIAIRSIRRHGPMPPGYKAKPLKDDLHGLYQLNFKVRGKQIRFLYSPFRKTVVFFIIHGKSSPQEQKHAYNIAKRRLREVEAMNKQSKGQLQDVPLLTVH
jgi:phage-related protein